MFLFNLTKFPLSKVSEQAIQFQQEYSDDFDSSFPNKCIHFCGNLSGLQVKNLPITVLYLNKIVEDPNISSFYRYI